ncbi:Xylb, partial [Symbiodinium pilosum]
MLVFKNGSLSRERVLKEACGGQWDTWAKMLADTKPGNGGSLGFYFHSPEITPTTGDKSGVFRFDGDSKEVDAFAGATEVRAVVEGKFLAMRAFAQGIGMDPSEVKRIIATGGASANKAILQVLADVFGVPVFTLDQPDSASLGAALRAGHGFRCLGAQGGFLPFADFLTGGRLDYARAAEPIPGAKEVYTELLPRFVKLQDQVLASLGQGSAKRQKT